MLERSFKITMPLLAWPSELDHKITSPPVVVMDLSRAKELSAEDFTHTSPLTPPERVSMLLLMVTPEPYRLIGPAMTKFEFTVNTDVLLSAPNVKPVKVLAKL